MTEAPFEIRFGRAPRISSTQPTQHKYYMPLLNEFMVGTATGVSGAGACFAIKAGFGRYILPHMRRLAWEGVDLTGEWIEEYQELTEPRTPQIRRITIKIEQTGTRLRGTAVMDDTPDSPTPVGHTNLKFEGAINQRFVFFTMIPTNKNNFGVAQYLLDLDPDGQRLKGVTSYYDKPDNSLATGICVLKRVPR